VESPLDGKTAKLLSSHIKEDYIRLAKVLDLSDKCETVKKMKGTTEHRCFFFLKTWMTQDGKKATLHLLMQKLREAGCEHGMKALLEHFKNLLENSDRYIAKSLSSSK
jgi:hypothetical protein